MLRMSPTTLLAVGALALAGPASSQSAPLPPQTFDWFQGDVADTTPWGQAVEVESTRLILSWTTAAEYTTPLVDHIPDHPTIVSPTDHFGRPIGEPGALHRVDEIHGYFRALDESTDRVRFVELGETEEGNRLGLVQVAGEATLSRLDRIREGYRRLGDPRLADAGEVATLVAELPAIYLITAGLHSTETGPPEMVMELAYRLAASDDPGIRAIRDSVLVMIVPVTEPDGRNRVVDWYRLHSTTPDTTVEVPRVPWWGKYIFHDNNRDGLQMTARLTQEVIGLINDWRVPLAHDLHESVPYLYTSTGTGPYNPDIDPIAVAEWTWFANYEVTALTAHGLPGVWTHGFYDGWNPTYLIWAANTRNGLGRFYETFGNSTPWTRERTLGERSTSVEWYRPNPPRDTTLWSLRNNTNYMQAGVLTALSLTAQNRTRLLRQFRTKNENAVRKGATAAPFAYHVPAEQLRPGDAAAMLRLLQRQGVELHRATDSMTIGRSEREEPADSAAGGEPGDSAAVGEPTDSTAADEPTDATAPVVRPGDYLIRMDQPYRNLVLTLMSRQEFPADAPRPYDDVAWTFPLMFGVDARAVADSAVLALAMEPVDSIPTTGAVRGDGEWWAVRATASAFSLQARLAIADTDVWAVEDSLEVEGEGVGPGTWLIRSRDLPAGRAADWAAAHGLTVIGVSNETVDSVERHSLDLPRIALLHSWGSTQAEGWARYTLDTFGVPYTYISDTELGELGRLRRRFDLILFPDQGGSARSIFQGLDPEDGPLAYRAGRDAPSLGRQDETDDMTGGMGLEGLAALRDFVEEGGTFVGLRTASTIPVHFGLVRDVDLRDTPDGLFVPGSVVRGKVIRRDHPLTYGFDEAPALHHRFGPYLSVDEEIEDEVVVVGYADDAVALSGLVQGASRLEGEPAVLDVPAGEGHWVLFGFNPLNRHQNFMNFAFVWNAILNWNDL
jgi:hypothetical protein